MFAINWGDVPTWLAVAVASVGGWIALRQLRDQQDVIRRQTIQLERQQAEQIQLRHTAVGFHIEKPGGVTARGQRRPVHQPLTWLKDDRQSQADSSRMHKVIEPAQVTPD